MSKVTRVPFTENSSIISPVDAEGKIQTSERTDSHNTLIKIVKEMKIMK